MEIIGKASRSGYSLYRFDCGHEQEAFRANVDKGFFRCQTCHINKYKTLCLEQGCTLLEYRKNPLKSIIKFNDCGHTKEVSTSHLAIGGIQCSICKENEILKIVEKSNFSVISIDQTNVEVSCNTCGSVETRRNVLVRQKPHIRCDCCFRRNAQEKMIREVEKHSIEFIERTTDKDYGIFRLPCGCIREMQYCAASNNSWRCNNCQISSFTEKAEIYLLRIKFDNTSFLKLGFTKDLGRRLSEYSSKDFEYEVINTKSFITGHAAMLFEKNLHEDFKEYKIPKSESKKYFDRSGFTECYPIAIESNLLRRLDG